MEDQPCARPVRVAWRAVCHIAGLLQVRYAMSCVLVHAHDGEGVSACCCCPLHCESQHACRDTVSDVGAYLACSIMHELYSKRQADLISGPNG